MPQSEDTTYPCGVTRRDTGRDFNPGFLNRFQQMTYEQWREKEQCRFHTQPQPVLQDFDIDGRGITLQYAADPSSTDHKLIRPAGSQKSDCWNEEEIRSIGGKDFLVSAFDNIFFPLMQPPTNYARIFHYNGEQSGASQPDFQIHFLPNPLKHNNMLPVIDEKLVSQKMVWNFRKSKFVVAEAGNVIMVCESIYSVGQCWILPKFHGSSRIEDVVEVLMTTMRLFAKAFPNTAEGKEGMQPDFCFFLDFEDGDLRVGSFVPWLARRGAEQSAMGIFPEVVIHHQWTPERTMQLLGLR